MVGVRKYPCIMILTLRVRLFHYPRADSSANKTYPTHIYYHHRELIVNPVLAGVVSHYSTITINFVNQRLEVRLYKKYGACLT